MPDEIDPDELEERIKALDRYIDEQQIGKILPYVNPLAEEIRRRKEMEARRAAQQKETPRTHASYIAEEIRRRKELEARRAQSKEAQNRKTSPLAEAIRKIKDIEKIRKEDKGLEEKVSGISSVVADKIKYACISFENPTTKYVEFVDEYLSRGTIDGQSLESLGIEEKKGWFKRLKSKIIDNAKAAWKYPFIRYSILVPLTATVLLFGGKCAYDAATGAKVREPEESVKPYVPEPVQPKVSNPIPDVEKIEMPKASEAPAVKPAESKKPIASVPEIKEDPKAVPENPEKKYVPEPAKPAEAQKEDEIIPEPITVKPKQEQPKKSEPAKELETRVEPAQPAAQPDIISKGKEYCSELEHLLEGKGLYSPTDPEFQAINNRINDAIGSINQLVKYIEDNEEMAVNEVSAGKSAEEMKKARISVYSTAGNMLFEAANAAEDQKKEEYLIRAHKYIKKAYAQGDKSHEIDESLREIEKAQQDLLKFKIDAQAQLKKILADCGVDPDQIKIKPKRSRNLVYVIFSTGFPEWDNESLKGTTTSGIEIGGFLNDPHWFYGIGSSAIYNHGDFFGTLFSDPSEQDNDYIEREVFASLGYQPKSKIFPSSFVLSAGYSDVVRENGLSSGGKGYFTWSIQVRPMTKPGENQLFMFTTGYHNRRGVIIGIGSKF